MQHHRLNFPPNTEDLQNVTQLFQALSDPTRLTLLLALMESERAVTELVQRLEQPQSTVSRHLAILRHAGLVQTRRDGPRVQYRLSDSHLGDLLQEAFSHAQHQRFELADHLSGKDTAGSRH